MSERKMYEVAIRMLGIVLLPRAIVSLALAIQTLVTQGNDPYGLGYVSSAIIAFLVFLAASAGLISLAPRLSKVFSSAQLAAPRTEGMNRTGYLHLGVTLVGVYVFANGLVPLVSYFLDLLRVSIENSGESAFRMTTHPLTATVQTVIGLVLVFHERLFRGPRHVQNEAPQSQQSSEEETPSQ
ncbi:hypothetical protein KKG90_11590 [Candidatus Bipolaricaulota bacterium]|nr:hypothetical protein [Candidatus Bipolaricaulota bacterium]